MVRLDVVFEGPPLRFALSVDDSVSHDPAAAQYVPAVTTGARYAWEKVEVFRIQSGVAVRILEIIPLAVDTTELTMVYAGALALWDGLRLQPARPIDLIAEGRSLLFPI